MPEDLIETDQRFTTNAAASQVLCDPLPASRGLDPNLQEKTPSTTYSYYALFVLVLVGVLNSADRTILSVLVEAIKADFQVTNAQIAFLYGTVFVTFYTVVGLPIARLADRIARPKLLGAGLVIWSGLTALSGLANSFAALSLARFGVGIGEATANPCAHSLICDYFPRRRRGLVLGAYLAGMALGGGLAAMVGGRMLNYWPEVCSQYNLCSVSPWQATFLIVGIPGLLVAMMVATLREPVRGAVDGAPMFPPKMGHWRALFRDLMTVLPVLSTIQLWRECGRRVAIRNLLVVSVVATPFALLAYATGDIMQWGAILVALVAILGWSERQNVVDPGLIKLTFLTPAFTLALGGFAIIGCIMGATHFWMIPYAIRTFEVSPQTAGLVIGPIIVISSIVGVLAGGALADAWRARDPRGYAWTAIAMLILLSCMLVLMLNVSSFKAYTISLSIFYAASLGWSGAAAAYAQDLVLPRMRATTSALFALCITLVTMATGPYFAGKVADVGGNLADGLLALLALAPIAIVLLWMAGQRYSKAIESKDLRAAQAETA